MEKELWIKYIDILNRQEESMNGEPFQLSTEEEETLAELQNVYENDPDKAELVKQLKECSREQRQEMVEEYFQPVKEDASEEEEIAEAFGISVEKITHKYLESGKELFLFYDTNLQREVIIENEEKGVPLKERLEKIQKENQKYQTSNDEENSKNILMDERNTKDLELAMYTKNEILNHPSLLSDMSQNDLLELDYLLKNYEDLHIKSINLENLIYLDESGEINEVSVNDKEEVVVHSTEEENSSSNEFYQKDDLSQMFEEDSKTEEINTLLLEQTEKPKQKVYVWNDNDGHVNKPIFITIVTVLFIIAIVCLLLIFKTT